MRLTLVILTCMLAGCSLASPRAGGDVEQRVSGLSSEIGDLMAKVDSLLKAQQTVNAGRDARVEAAVAKVESLIRSEHRSEARTGDVGRDNETNFGVTGRHITIMVVVFAVYEAFKFAVGQYLNVRASKKYAAKVFTELAGKRARE